MDNHASQRVKQKKLKPEAEASSSQLCSLDPLNITGGRCQTSRAAAATFCRCRVNFFCSRKIDFQLKTCAFCSNNFLLCNWKNKNWDQFCSNNFTFEAEKQQQTNKRRYQKSFLKQIFLQQQFFFFFFAAENNQQQQNKTKNRCQFCSNKNKNFAATKLRLVFVAAKLRFVFVAALQTRETLVPTKMILLP